MGTRAEASCGWHTRPARHTQLTPSECDWRTSYSNTNYIALGLIAEKVPGESCRTELTQRILRSVKLTATELPTPRTLAHLAQVRQREAAGIPATSSPRAGS
ncbi:MAG: serine hydrolase [Solirubrobacteraceae bacterium]